jgi:ABC-type uncharacterized transport system ATPase subunit
MPPALPRLELIGITKHYPGVVANDGVSLAVEPGQIHAVLGENGAGKSTLMKIIYGAVKPDAGQIRFDGHPVTIRDPRAARALGIAMVFQHFSLFETLTVAENVWLGLDRPMPLAQVVRRIRETAEVYGLPIDPLRPVHTLAVGQMQRVEIIRALLTEPRLLILDEPTSVLTPQAVDKLFETLRQLARQGCSLLYISHKLHEIQALCTACTVLRAGRVTGTCDPRAETPGSLSRLMIGAQSQPCDALVPNSTQEPCFMASLFPLAPLAGRRQGEGAAPQTGASAYWSARTPHPNPLPTAWGEGEKAGASVKESRAPGSGAQAGSAALHQSLPQAGEGLPVCPKCIYST